VINSGPIPVTRTSLPAAAVVAVVNRCSASRACEAACSSTRRSTAGRIEELNTGGRPNTTSSSNSGCTEASSARVTASRTNQPRVPSTDMYMWSRTKT
jgi:hypothetical protein